MEPIRSISELPFHEVDPYQLLNLEEDREGYHDDDYYQFGYARVETVHLVERDSPEPLPVVRDALLLALHSADEPEPLEDDIELEFFIDDVVDEGGEEDEDYSVTVLLSDFLARWLPMVTGSERAIVLVLCNPFGATIAKPSIVAGIPVYYAMGEDVVSSIESVDLDGNRLFIDLVADRWRLAE